MTGLKLPLILLLTALWSACTACTPPAPPARVILVPQACPLGPLPDFPELTTARPCGPDACIGAGDLNALYLWARDVQRWAEMARVCLDVRDAPPLKPFVGAVGNELYAVMEGTRIAADLTVRDMVVHFSWFDCDAFNAGYDPISKTVAACLGVAKAGAAVTRFVIAHEMAHAIVRQLNLPYTGSEETAADELAALLRLDDGHPEDVMAAADAFAAMSGGTTQPWNDDHPPSGVRARVLRCLAIGAQGGDWLFDCRETFRRAADAWSRILQ